MEIKSQHLSLVKLKDVPTHTLINEAILPGEIKSVTTEFMAMKGSCSLLEEARDDVYDVFLILNGSGAVQIANSEFKVSSEYIIRIPYATSYQIHSYKDNELYFIRIRKNLDEQDKKVILQNPELHSECYIKSFSECATYTEDIKSAKTINRMLLPVGYVPRFCMGSVHTEGPDQVASHKHPMLDQFFLGLKDCKCSCSANGAQVLLTENTLLHIPLGSTHAVSVTDGDILSYIWMDFFLTIEGQTYMSEQHQIDDK